MQTIQKVTGTERDANGFAPGRTQACDNGEDCLTCAGLGWVLCDHAGQETEFDPYNSDGHMIWCARCSAPADNRKTWTWCTEREN